MHSTNHYFKKALAKSSAGIRTPFLYLSARRRQLFAGFFMRATLHT